MCRSPSRNPHTPHTYYEVICVGGVLLSHNPTIAVPSAQSSLATGIGTGPGVPSTLKPPTQTQFETNHPSHPTRVQTVCCVKHCTTNTNTIIISSSVFCGKHIVPGNTFLHRPHMKNTLNVVFCVGVLVPVTLQHVTMLTALAYQPHHLWGTSIETSS